MTSIIVSLCFVIWLAGAVATNAATRQMGLANPNTIYDSFSGDDTLDFGVIILWPLFWPLYVVHCIVTNFAAR